MQNNVDENLIEMMTQMMTQMGQRARRASRALAGVTTADKNRALSAIADALLAAQTQLLAANAVDVANARARGLDAAMIDRLTLTPNGVRTGRLPFQDRLRPAHCCATC